jgi:hypothetical protein
MSWQLILGAILLLNGLLIVISKRFYQGWQHFRSDMRDMQPAWERKINDKIMRKQNEWYLRYGLAVYSLLLGLVLVLWAIFGLQYFPLYQFLFELIALIGLVPIFFLFKKS